MMRKMVIFFQYSLKKWKFLNCIFLRVDTFKKFEKNNFLYTPTSVIRKHLFSAPDQSTLQPDFSGSEFRIRVFKEISPEQSNISPDCGFWVPDRLPHGYSRMTEVGVFKNSFFQNCPIPLNVPFKFLHFFSSFFILGYSCNLQTFK